MQIIHIHIPAGTPAEQQQAISKAVDHAVALMIEKRNAKLATTAAADLLTPLHSAIQETSAPINPRETALKIARCSFEFDQELYDQIRREMRECEEILRAKPESAAATVNTAGPAPTHIFAHSSQRSSPAFAAKTYAAEATLEPSNSVSLLEWLVSSNEPLALAELIMDFQENPERWNQQSATSQDQPKAAWSLDSEKSRHHDVQALSRLSKPTLVRMVMRQYQLMRKESDRASAKPQQAPVPS